MPIDGTITFSVINYAESTYDYGLLSDIDKHLTTNASADTSNVYWSGQNNNGEYVQTVTYQMSSGNHTIDAKFFKDNYSDAGNDSLQFKVSITLNGTPSYETYWYYDLVNIITDHIIVVTVGDISKLYVNQNGTWTEVEKAYKKINGAWVEQNIEDIMSTSANYVRG
jgi:hypothetical protein